MSNVVPHRGTGPVATSHRGGLTSAAGLSPTSDVESAAWNHDRPTVESYGLFFPFQPTPPVGHGLRQDNSVRRRGTHYFRRVVAWKAYPTFITVLTGEQMLRPRSDGKFEPSGGWVVQPPQEFTFRSPATIRRGDVADDSQHHLQDQLMTEKSLPENKKFLDAFHQMQYLPLPVRKSVLARANPPSLFQAESLQSTRGDGTMFYTVNVMRINDREAIVVQASRQAHSALWQVQQFHYTTPNHHHAVSPSAESNALRS
jgi:hypothetical protein